MFKVHATGAVDLPEAAGLAPLVVPSKSPMRHDHASPPPDSSAAVAEAFAHGDKVQPTPAVPDRYIAGSTTPLLVTVTAFFSEALDPQIALIPCKILLLYKPCILFCSVLV